MASFLFQAGLHAHASGSFTWGADDVGVLLLEVGFVEDPTINTLAGIAGERSDTGYLRQALTGCTTYRSDGDLSVLWQADDVVFPDLGDGSSPDVAGAVLFVDLGSDAASLPLVYLADVADTPNGTDYTVAFDAGTVARFG